MLTAELNSQVGCQRREDFVKSDTIHVNPFFLWGCTSFFLADLIKLKREHFGTKSAWSTRRVCPLFPVIYWSYCVNISEWTLSHHLWCQFSCWHKVMTNCSLCWEWNFFRNFIFGPKSDQTCKKINYPCFALTITANHVFLYLFFWLCRHFGYFSFVQTSFCKL